MPCFSTPSVICWLAVKKIRTGSKETHHVHLPYHSMLHNVGGCNIFLIEPKNHKSRYDKSGKASQMMITSPSRLIQEQCFQQVSIVQT